jgi:hypothetical protein
MSGIHLYFRLYSVSFSHLRQISLFSKKNSSTLFSYEMFLTGEFVCVVEVGDVVINYCLIFYFQLLEPLFYVIKFNNQRKLFIENSRNRSNTLIWWHLKINWGSRGRIAVELTTACANQFSLNIFYLPIKQTKWIRHKLNKLMKSSPNYNMLQ